MPISRRAFLRGFSAAAGIAALAGCGLLGQSDPADGEGIGIIAPARITDQPDPNSTPTAEPDTWHMGAPMPTPRALVAGAAIQGWIYVMGGLREGGASDDNEAYDPFTDRWQEAAPLPQPLAHAAAVGADGAIYLRTAASRPERQQPTTTGRPAPRAPTTRATGRNQDRGRERDGRSELTAFPARRTSPQGPTSAVDDRVPLV